MHNLPVRTHIRPKALRNEYEVTPPKIADINQIRQALNGLNFVKSADVSWPIIDAIQVCVHPGTDATSEQIVDALLAVCDEAINGHVATWEELEG